MASNAYITDGKMMEFHRINGNQTMNFWRLSGTKQFTHFYPGDYLFFLAKGSEKKDTKEKGIIGYGKFNSSKSMSLTQMWNQFETLNGFSTKEEFKEAVKKISKTKQIPKTMHSLFLTDILFFSSPVYLSELDIIISTNLESYIYLNKQGVEATVKILKKAQQIGIDMWQAALDASINQEIFKTDVIVHTIAKKVNEIINYNKTESKILKKFMQNNQKDWDYIKGSRQALYNIKSKQLYLPLELKSKDKEAEFFEVIGKLLIIMSLLNDEPECKALTLELGLLVDKQLDEQKQSICKQVGISWIQL